MRIAQVVLVGAACCIALTAKANAQAVSSDSFASARSLAELRSRFDRGRRPSPKELVGRWTMQTEIIREDGDGADQVKERVSGARRDDIRGHPFEWTLEIRRVSGSAYEVTSHNPWEPTGDTYPVRFIRSEITFDKEFGSDMAETFRCRAPGARRLVCLYARDPGWKGLEFTKDR